MALCLTAVASLLLAGLFLLLLSHLLTLGESPNPLCQ